MQGFLQFIFRGSLKMSAEETEKTTTTAAEAAAEAPAGDEEEEWLYGGKTLLSQIYVPHYMNL